MLLALVRRGMLIAIVLCTTVTAAPILPTFAPADFTPEAPIDNPYFPLAPGTTFRWTATITDPDTQEQASAVDEDHVTSETIQIAGVTARVVHATSFEDDVQTEDTRDYYAQDKSGNVWYLGEDTKAFEFDDEGNLVNTDTTGSWRAGVNGALPGFIMPANPTVGFEYFQENAPNDGALDQAQVVSLTETANVPFGNFTNVLKTEETTQAEPGVLEFKFYAPGVGQVMVFEDVQPNGQPLNTFVLESVTTSPSAIPLPPAIVPGFATLLGAVTVVRRWTGR